MARRKQQPQPKQAVQQRRQDQSVGIVEKLKTDLETFLGSHSLDQQVWMRSCVRELRKAVAYATSKNQVIPLDMMENAVLEAARAGYEPGNHCYFIWYGGNDADLKCLTAFEGAFERVNMMDGCEMEPPVVVREGDHFVYKPFSRDPVSGDLKPFLEHEPLLDGDAPMIGAYVVYRVNGKQRVEWAPRSYMEAIKKGIRNQSSAWFGPFEAEMWRKTMVFRGNKYMPKGLPLLSGDRLDTITDEPSDRHRIIDMELEPAQEGETDLAARLRQQDEQQQDEQKQDEQKQDEQDAGPAGEEEPNESMDPATGELFPADRGFSGRRGQSPQEHPRASRKGTGGRSGGADRLGGLKAPRHADRRTGQGSKRILNHERIDRQVLFKRSQYGRFSRRNVLSPAMVGGPA